MGIYEPISEEDGKKFGFGRYPVTVVPHVLVPVSDGTKLSIKFWFPQPSLEDTSFPKTEHHVMYKPKDALLSSAPVPVLMEYIPYRKSDATLIRDHRRLMWFSSHGYVCARVDMRGTGESEGLYYGEYLEQEQKDACDIIAWFAEQKWCNGRVGMYGKSWGGFNSLQVAYEQPEALKAVIAFHATDDRYASDVHYMDGCILGNQALWWSSYMFSLNASPPHPGLVPTWRHTWRQRLEANHPWVNDWLSEQLREDYWRHGSVCEDPDRLTCPILMIGGWNDGYRNAKFRAMETFPQVRVMIGPWCHEWPDMPYPGPVIGIKDECLKWWEHHLKGMDNGAMEMPTLRAYMQDAFTPDPEVAVDRKGQWVTEPKWPPEDASRWRCFIPDNCTGGLVEESRVGSSLDTCESEVNFADVAGHGVASGEWWFMKTNSLPSGQQLERPHSHIWRSEKLDEDIPILGFPELEVTVKIKNSDGGMIAVRICDVFPDGQVTLVSYGLLNLTHRDGHSKDKVKPLTPGQSYKVRVKCMSTGYIIPKGHQLEVAVAPNYWPLCWPPKDKVKMVIKTGPGMTPGNAFYTKLIIPVLGKDQEMCITPPFPPPRKDHPVLPMKELRPAAYRRHVEQDISSKSRTLVVTADDGKVLLHQTGTITGTSFQAKYQMIGDDPLSTNIDIKYKQEFEYPDIEGGITSVIHTRSKMRSDAEKFYLNHELKVEVNGEDFYYKTWDKTIQRQYV